MTTRSSLTKDEALRIIEAVPGLICRRVDPKSFYQYFKYKEGKCYYTDYFITETWFPTVRIAEGGEWSLENPSAYQAEEVMRLDPSFQFRHYAGGCSAILHYKYENNEVVYRSETNTDGSKAANTNWYRSIDFNGGFIPGSGTWEFMYVESQKVLTRFDIIG